MKLKCLYTRDSIQLLTAGFFNDSIQQFKTGVESFSELSFLSFNNLEDKVLPLNSLRLDVPHFFNCGLCHLSQEGLIKP